MDEVPPELLAWTFESCLTAQHLPILPLVCRRWRDVCANAALRRAMLRGVVLSFGGDSHFAQSVLGHPRQEGARWAAPAQIGALRGLRIAAVAAGENHSLFLTGSASQLGFAGCQEEDLCQMHYVPERVSGLDDVVVVKIAAGPTHSLVLTSTAAERQPVYSFGENQYGHLVLGDHQNRWTPTLVEALRGKEIVEVVAGYMNSAAITKRGQVFMWGSCRSCIDLPSCDPTKPTLVDALCGTPIAAVALGECHCLFLTTDGLVLSCGLDSYHSGSGRSCQLVSQTSQLGAPATGEGHSWCSPETAASWPLGKIAAVNWGWGARRRSYTSARRPNCRARSVRSRTSRWRVWLQPRFTAVQLPMTAVYSFGDGEFYQLGHGTTDSWNVPKKIDALVPFFVRSVATARVHTLVLL